MYNRYQGNTGKVIRVEDSAPLPQNRPGTPELRQAPPRRNQLFDGLGSLGKLLPKSLGSLGKLLPKSLGQIETEDIILLLILYLMYKESGDSELLMIMGAMFLL